MRRIWCRYGNIRACPLQRWRSADSRSSRRASPGSAPPVRSKAPPGDRACERTRDASVGHLGKIAAISGDRHVQDDEPAHRFPMLRGERKRDWTPPVVADQKELFDSQVLTEEPPDIVCHRLLEPPQAGLRETYLPALITRRAVHPRPLALHVLPKNSFQAEPTNCRRRRLLLIGLVLASSSSPKRCSTSWRSCRRRNSS